jgi:putative transposase
VASLSHVGAITYIWTWSGFAYLATVIDLASRAIVGWTVADHMRTKLVTDRMHMAFVRRRPAGGSHSTTSAACSQYPPIV